MTTGTPLAAKADKPDPVEPKFKFDDLKPIEGLNGPFDLSCEQYRVYQYRGSTVRANDPVALYVGKSTHRVLLSSGKVLCVPVPGLYGCALTWENKEGYDPVGF